VRRLKTGAANGHLPWAFLLEGGCGKLTLPEKTLVGVIFPLEGQLKANPNACFHYAISVGGRFRVSEGF
jgi:hypothetical protein